MDKHQSVVETDSINMKPLEELSTAAHTSISAQTTSSSSPPSSISTSTSLSTSASIVSSTAMNISSSATYTSVSSFNSSHDDDHQCHRRPSFRVILNSSNAGTCITLKQSSISNTGEMHPHVVTSSPPASATAASAATVNVSSSPPSSALPQLSLPHAPLVLKCLYTAVSLEWSAVECKLPIMYSIEARQQHHEDNVYVSVWTGQSTAATVTDLDPSTLYDFRIVASFYARNPSAKLHARGAKMAVDASRVISPVSTAETLAPTLPCTPALSARTKNSLSVRWTIPDCNGAVITLYKIEWTQGKTTSDDDSAVEPWKLMYSGSKLVAKTPGKLKPGQWYSFRVSACNSVGWSTWSSVAAFSTSAAVPSPPAQPFIDLNQNIILDRATQLLLTWHAVEGNGAPILTYTLEMDDPLNSFGFTPLYNGNERKFHVTGLKRLTEYRFRVLASNAQGDSQPGAIAKFTTGAEPPDCPSIISTRSTPQRDVVVTWRRPTDVGGLDISKYIVALFVGSEEKDRICVAENIVTCTFPTLLPGILYSIRIACVNEEDVASKWSPLSSVRTPAVVPGVVNHFRLAKSGQTCLSLRWDEPDHMGGSDQLPNFDVEIAPDRIVDGNAQHTTPSFDENDIVFKCVYNGKDNNIVIDKLKSGCIYIFRVRASNEAGSGPWSSPWLSVNTNCSSPAKPSLPVVERQTCTNAVLTWPIPACHGMPITGYSVELLTANCNTIFARVKGPHYEAVGLLPATSYQFRVQATNGAGHSAWGPYIEFSTLAGAPSAPAQPTLVKRTDSALTVAWRIPKRLNGSHLRSFEIHLTGPGEDRHVVISIADSSSGQCIWEYSFLELAANSTFRVRVQASNAAGSSPYSTPLSSSTAIPILIAPVVKAEAIDKRTCRISWRYPDTLPSGVIDGDINYIVEMASSATKLGSNVDEEEHVFSQLRFNEIYTGSSNAFKATKLSANVYYFRVCSVTESGHGEWSKYICVEMATAPLPALSPPHVSLLDDNGKHIVTWKLPKGLINQIRCELEFDNISDGSKRTVFSDSKTSHIWKIADNSESSNYRCRVRLVGSKSVSRWSAWTSCSTTQPVKIKAVVTDTTPTSNNKRIKSGITEETFCSNSEKDISAAAAKIVAIIATIVSLAISIITAMLTS